MVNNVSMLMCNDVSKPLKLDYKFARVDNSNRLDTFFFLRGLDLFINNKLSLFISSLETFIPEAYF